MSTLIVNELFEDVVFEQPVRILRSTSVAFIRPWIYKNGVLLSGTFRLQVYDGATLLKTVDIPYATINTEIPGTYAHGYIRFDTSPLALNVGTTEEYHEYTLKFSMVGYTNNLNSYIGLCRDWEYPKYVVANGTVNDADDAVGLELYSYRS